ncbi:MAG: tetratricopeptide repeat protein [Microcoleaceae cyanobacterium]
MRFSNTLISILLGISTVSCELIHQNQASDTVTESTIVKDKSETIKNRVTSLEKAKKLAWEASQLVQNPPHPQSTWQTAQQRWQQAIQVLEKIPPESSDFVEAQQKLTQYKNNYLLIQQQYQKAEQANLLNRQAIQQIELEDYQTAIITLNQAIAINPGETKLYLNRGVAYAKLNSHQSAIANYNKAIEVQPNFAEAYYYRGDEYLQKGELKIALIDYNQAIKLNPDYSFAYLDRGFIYAEMGDNQKAVNDLKQAAKLLDKEGNITTKNLALEVAQQLQPSLEINDELEEIENITEIPEDDVQPIIIKEKQPVIIYRNRRPIRRRSRRTRRRR